MNNVSAYNQSLFYDNANTSSVARGTIWSVVPVFSLIVLILATISNGLVLYLFIRHANLRTAFGVYVINLVVSNLIETWIQLPLYLINNLRSYWWIGTTACSIYLYGDTLWAILFCSHALITINRIWAVAAPVSYRARHTKKVSVILCIAVWAYVHIIRLPYGILDALYYRISEQFGCFINNASQVNLSIAQQLSVYTFPVAIVIFAYPYIAYKTLRSRLVGPAGVTTSIKMDKVTKNDPERKTCERTNTSKSVTTAKKRNTGFLLLSLLTISMVVA